jgi:PKD repeat protein
MKMKKNILLLIMIFVVGFISLGKVSAQMTSCTSPMVISSLPYIGTGMTTADDSIRFTASMACGSSYMTGKAHIFAYTPSSNEVINLAVTGATLFGTGLFVVNDCPTNVSASCVKAEALTGGLSLANVSLTGGVTYYIIVSTYDIGGFNPSTNFDISISKFSPVGVVSLDTPVSGCSLTSSEVVKISVANNTASDLDSIFYSYSFNGSPFVTEQDFNTILAGDTGTYTFLSPADLSASDLTYTFTLASSVTIGGVVYNDTTYSAVVNSLTISTFPYLESFTTGAGGWMPIGNLLPTTYSWALGNPHKAIINHPTAVDTMCWVTNLTSTITAENSYVMSPCLNLGGLQHPVLEFDIWYELGAMAIAQFPNIKVQYTKDNGTTWSLLGAQGDPFGWYNTQYGWQGSTGNWIHVRHDMDSIAGVTDAKIRILITSVTTPIDGIAFDNINIYEKPANDVGVTKIIAPVSGCELTNQEVVTIEIKNFGTATQTSIPVKYKVDNGTYVSQTYSGSIAMNGVANYTFTVNADLSATGMHTITALTDLTGDAARANDTIWKMVQNSPVISTFPYNEDFEAGNGNWVSGMNSTWAWGVPAKPAINAAHSPTHAWATNLTGFANSGEKSFLASPCLDFSTLGNPYLEFYIWYNTSAMGAVSVQASSNNGPWQTITSGSGAGENWYTTPIIPLLPLGWTGNSAGYVKVGHTVDGFANLSDVRLRILYKDSVLFVPNTVDGVAVDDIKIYDCILPIAQFTSSVSDRDVTLTNTSTGGGTYLWNFGDGTTDTTANPVHNYAADNSYTITLVVTNSCGSNTISHQVTVTGIGEYKNADFINCMPNPSTGVITVSFNDASIHSFNLKLQSITGAELYSEKLVNTGVFNKKFDFSNLSKGIYFLKLETENSTFIKKIVIE